MTFKKILLKLLFLYFIWNGVLAFNNETKFENNNKTRKTCTTGCYNRLKFGANGRYNVKIHGIGSNYRPDTSGEYLHIKVPYDGGYGYRGQKDLVNIGQYNDQQIDNNHNSDHDVSSDVINENDQGVTKPFFNDSEIDENENSYQNNKLETSILTKSEDIKSVDTTVATEEPSINQDMSTTDENNQSIQDATETPSDINNSFEVIQNKDSISFADESRKIKFFRSPYAAEIFQSIKNELPPPSYLKRYKNNLYAPKFPYNAYDGLKLFRIEGNADYNVTYHYTYETENNIEAEETGYLENLGKKEPKMHVKGFYHYETGDGEKYKVNYEANQYGFYPQGSHLHKTIQQALQYLKIRLQENE